MIIKKLAKLVKKTHYLGITSTINERSQQWLGGNRGLYDISDLPSITYEQACAMFDFSAKTIDKTWDDNDGAWILAKKVETACKFRRFEADEIEIHSTFFGDEEMKVVVDKDQTAFAFIPAELLSPIVETEYTQKVLIQGEDDATYLLVYNGLQLVAMIPSLRIPKGMVDSWQESQTKIYDCMSLYLNTLAAEEERRAASDSEVEHQYTFDENEDTEDEEDAE